MSAFILVLDDSGAYSEPVMILGYETYQESQNKIHDLIGGGIAVTLVKPRPRKGTLDFFFLNEETATDCLQLHGRESTFMISDEDRAIVTMYYVVSGSISMKLDEETRNRWVVSIDYQEVKL